MPDHSLVDALQLLCDAVKKLPSSTPVGHSSGIVYRNFRTKPSGIKGDVWRVTADAYARCFRNPASPKPPKENVLRGQYGMDCLLAFFEELIDINGLSSSTGFMIEQTIKQITSLVYDRIGSLPSDQVKSSGVKKRAQILPRSNNPEHEVNDRSYIPDKDLGDQSSNERSESSDSEILAPKESHADKTHDKANKDMEGESHAHFTFEPRDGQANTNRPGPTDTVRQWAFSNFEAPVATKFENGNPAWEFKCKHCGSFRRVPRTEGCEIIKHEPKAIASTNLASHLRSKCKKIPQSDTWEAVQARIKYSTTMQETPTQSLGAMFASPLSMPPPPPTIISPTIFRSTLIQSVVRDTFPLSFGEGEGMKQLFLLLNPLLALPSHQTMRRDLEKLYMILVDRVQQVMADQSSRISVTSDAWSSKSSIYTLAGVVVTFIDHNWSLQELVVDLVHLAADHTGATMGQKVFQSLDRKKAARNLIASVTDNASNNRTMNKEISRRVKSQSGYDLNVANMTVTCICHAMHLICSAILSNLGIVGLAEAEDGYQIVKGFDFSERLEESEEIREEEARLRGEKDSSNLWIPAAESGDELSDSEGENLSEGDDSDGGDNGEGEDEEAGSNEGGVRGKEGGVEEGKRGRKKRAKPLTPPQKVSTLRFLKPEVLAEALAKIHAIAVHCTASPPRRKAMGEFIRLYCSVLLAVIKSMAIRWNTVLAEMRRALLLRPAFDHWVNTLDTGKTGKERRIAQKLKQKWSMTDQEWIVPKELVRILEPFEEATLSFSKKGKIHLSDVLPTYMQLRTELKSSRNRLSTTYGPNRDPYGLIKAISAGEKKLDKYLNLAQQSDLTIIASVLHPGMRLHYFKDVNVWGQLMQRGQILLEHLFETYKLEIEELHDGLPLNKQPRPTLSKQSWSDRLLQMSSTSDPEVDDELSRYLENIYKYQGGTNVLKWWSEHEHDFPILSRIARDYLAVPATSVSVERLFSQCKLVMSDYCTMSVETARRIITCQQWLRAGLGVNLPDFLSHDRFASE